MHESSLELSLVFTGLGLELALGLHASIKSAFELRYLALEHEFALAVDVPLCKKALVYLAVEPGVLALAMFLPVLKAALVLALVGVDLGAFTMRAVVPPVSRVHGPVGDVVETALTVEGVVLELALVERPIRVNKNAVLAGGHSLAEVALVVDAVFAEYLAIAVGPPVLPLPVIKATWHCCQLVDRQLLPPLEGNP